MTQPSLFVDDVCTGHHHNNPESRDAFAVIEPHLGRLQILVLTHVAEHDAGGTVKSVRRDCKLEHQTASARLTELLQAGYIERNGKRRDRCAVVQATEAGRKALASAQPLSTAA